MTTEMCSPTFVKAVLCQAVSEQDELWAVHGKCHGGWLQATMHQQRLQGCTVQPGRREDQSGAASCAFQHAMALGDAAQSDLVLRMRCSMASSAALTKASCQAHDTRMNEQVGMQT